jgi:predicted AlkP superfamily phosphohydrolase/phosphomutase
MIIGLDGATWDVLEPWIQDGTLPHLARLRRNGSWGVLQSSIPPITAAAWSTFMTGKRPGKHGVYHFIKLFEENDDRQQLPELVNSRSIQSSTLWDVMGHHDRRVVLINIPLTYPARPVNGVMLTGLLTPKNASVFTYPPELSQQITDYQIDLERFIDKKPFVDDFSGETISPSLALVDEFYAMEEKRARVTLSMLHAHAWDFAMVVFTATDRMGHYLWQFHRTPNEQDRPEVRELCEAVRNFYRRLDEMVGELVAAAGPDTAMIVMSDHGMGPPQVKQFHGNNWLMQQGWLKARSNQKQSTFAADRWLQRLGIPRDKIGRLLRRVPRLARSKVMQKAAAQRALLVDTQRSRAYGLPIFFNIMGIRINAPEREKDILREQIMQQLVQVIDPENGQRVVARALRGEEYYSGPHAEKAPEIIAILDPAYGCSYNLGQYSAVVTRRPMVSGPAKHRPEGILIANGPGIAVHPDPLPNLHIEDVAPSVLHLMDLPVPSDVDGRSLTELLDANLLTAQPLRRCEPVELWTAAAAALGDEEMSAEDEALIRERLQALGYFD